MRASRRERDGGWRTCSHRSGSARSAPSRESPDSMSAKPWPVKPVTSAAWLGPDPAALRSTYAGQRPRADATDT